MATQPVPEARDPFEFLYPYEFLLLTTFRKNGVAVPTTVWFAHADGKIFVTTQSTAGKAKRIRSGGRVLLAPCDRVGNILGEQIEAQARIESEEEFQRTSALFAQKYGEQFVALTTHAGGASHRIYIEIQPETFA